MPGWLDATAGPPRAIRFHENTAATVADSCSAAVKKDGDHMESCNSFRRSLLHIITGAALLLVAANQAFALRCTALPGDDRYSVLDSVQAMHQARMPRQGPLLTVFEIGGGDPALNGSFLYLRLDHNDQVFVWKTGLNVRSVQQLSTGPGNTFVIRAKEDFFDGNNRIRSREVSYKINFHLTNDMIQDVISVETSTESHGGIKQ